MMAQIRNEMRAEVEHEVHVYLALQFPPPLRASGSSSRYFFFPRHLYRNFNLLFEIFLCIEFIVYEIHFNIIILCME
jgi:hypothetical protein